MIKLKKNAPFRSCISQISITLIDNAEDLLISIPIYNLLEYSQNYFMTSGSLWNFYRDEIHDVDDNTLNCKSFEYKTKIVGNTPERSGNEEDAIVHQYQLYTLKSLYHSNILVIFGNLLIRHW